MRKVLFVCLGNICRSPMAEFICKQIRPDIYCEYRAVSYEEDGNDMYPEAKRCLDNHSIAYSKHRATRIQQKDYDKFDEIYVMDNSNLRRINTIVDDYDNKIRLLDNSEIQDPWWTGDFEGVYRQLYDAIESL